MTTVLPLTVRVVVVTVTPEAVVVATECVTCGAPGACELASVRPAEAAAPPACEAVPAVGAGAGDDWWARATAAAQVPTTSAAAVQLDIRRTLRMLSRRGRTSG